ncbi:UDP-2,4-diacetamido-2,4,6-trideoxy-beta-L-altropyranose hydrolase [Aquirufa salirivi]|uniref:UDP-2,4-diacetamido-2,4, 6-trideoxy-beta-L-altropyranose hydrolase n=1 Tax=Aquirufa salirivi TaxID=3104729 RepID=A0ABW8RTJ2_9BACT
MKRKIKIRTDGSSEIGLGHLVRCISLANMLVDYYEIKFVCKFIPDEIVKEFENSKFELVKIFHELEFFEAICSDEIVVLDGYNFDFDYHITVKERCFKLICIDDMHEQKFNADLIINHAPGISKSDYNAASNTKFALGLEFALLRPLFLKQAVIQRKIEKLNTVLICFGGADEINLTKKVVQEIIHINHFEEIIVITGSAYKHLRDLENYIRNNERVTHIHHADEVEMLESMLKADLAIVPASGILVEILAVGCIPVSGYYIDNQLNIYNGYKKLNAIVDAGDLRNMDIKEIIKNINILNHKNIIDGKSGLRIVEMIKSLEYENSNISR